MSSENSVSKSLPPLTTRKHQRNTSEFSNDSGYSHTSITTPDKEKRFESVGTLDLHSHSQMKRRPPSAQATLRILSGIQEHVPSSFPKSRSRTRSMTTSDSS